MRLLSSLPNLGRHNHMTLVNQRKCHLLHRRTGHRSNIILHGDHDWPARPAVNILEYPHITSNCKVRVPHIKSQHPHQSNRFTCMGIDRGFDLHPPLEKKADDMELWASFLNAVQKHYEEKGDTVMRIDEQGNIVFKVGEHPTLLRQCHRFRRFSAKISGSLCGNVEKYLIEVERIAKKYFGSRVVPWSEWIGDFGVYGWDEVYAARNLP